MVSQTWPGSSTSPTFGRSWDDGCCYVHGEQARRLGYDPSQLLVRNSKNNTITPHGSITAISTWCIRVKLPPQDVQKKTGRRA